MQQVTHARLGAYAKWLVFPALLLVITGWLLNSPPGLLGKADAIGYAVCHRIDSRSFHIGERQLPLCARCNGMYLGAVIGLGYQAVVGKKRSGSPPWRAWIPLALLFIAFGVDGSNSYLYLIKETYPGALSQIPNLYVPNNILRLLTGTGMGVTIAAALFPAFNQTAWRETDERPAVTGLKSLGLLLVLGLAVDLLVLTGSPIVLYPAAFISAAGVLVLLSMVYSMLWLMIMRQENSFSRLREMALPLLAGLTLALLQISLLDAGRFWLTGTWGSFPLS